MNIIERLTNQIDRIQYDKERLREKLNQLTVAVEKQDRLKDDVYLQSSSLDVLSALIEKINEQNIEGMVKLVNQAISYIFDDREFTVYQQIEESRGVKTFNLFLIENKNGQEIHCNIRDHVGDGVRTIVGLMVLIYYLQVSGAHRFIVLDESLASVADCYLDNLFAFIRNIATQGKFVFLMVSHDVRVFPYVDNKYIMQNGRLTVYENS